ncbi:MULTISPECIES: putative lipid II flippase FtsW [Pasteurellaceae]|uniref:Probable peptidoglycan glycosyltransferase FtsW n=1 Tax=Pasteurella atlantica TaxID=2827233 RepID=A0AAW8CGD3_9PAST|nr:putative lipid II flippase FtsW [Pasteurella atlantica]MBR0574042.1 putative lipid II flippase FtsW [Pasteurella atlantica]MDP8040004.1 putative lipid II flippase FtsW [Pasteurella atlantica]MDP8042118.1 putative lipid II flippase FtsW [Pasteurella atlantica]MDP8044246.1 putative lipid II flippase FtsW [Pasteurella atlantica]MDP8046317.1 putative lipid II flippase FtsW [Pasteurella atlantica]
MSEQLAKDKKIWFELTPQNVLYDRTLMWLFFALLVFGFIVVTSASIPAGLRLKNDPIYFALRDVVYIFISLCILFFFIQIPIQKWEKYNIGLFFIALALLIGVLFVGHNVNGATRWIRLGMMNFQPAELAKLAIICYFAGFYVRKFDEMRNRMMSFVRPMIILSLFGSLLILQPDLGSTVVIFVLTFAMLFIVGARIFQFLFLGITGGGLFLFFVLTSEYRLKRVKTFLDPWADAYGDGFQLTNSQMAFGQGELFGKGLGNSVQKLGYLPEAHTDFIMAVVGEELGFIGILSITLLFVLLSLRALKISRESLLLEERFKGFFSFGIGIWIFLQSFVNLGVASGLLPTKGLTFPLVSYGGSSLIIMSIAIAILLRIDYENRLANLQSENLNKNEESGRIE